MFQSFSEQVVYPSLGSHKHCMDTLDSGDARWTAVHLYPIYRRIFVTTHCDDIFNGDTLAKNE